MDYSTKRISEKLLEEIKEALQNVNYGSVEIFVQNDNVTQITVRNIRKTGMEINGDIKYQRNGNGKSKIRVLTIEKQ
ncbi:MAG: YezD family protein [Patescibacteria group bacterium]|nr:YezD family protein [Patescibacteria group bacterium]